MTGGVNLSDSCTFGPRTGIVLGSGRQGRDQPMTETHGAPADQTARVCLTRKSEGRRAVSWSSRRGLAGAARCSMAPKSVAVVIGTRPEAIKMAEIIRILGPAGLLIHTG